MMGRMKFQFGTSSLLLATAFIGIGLAGTAATSRFLEDKYLSSPFPPSYLGMKVSLVASYLFVVGPVWLPAAFASYAVGRRALTAKILFVFAIAEVLAVAAMFTWGLR